MVLDYILVLNGEKSILKLDLEELLKWLCNVEYVSKAGITMLYMNFS